MIARTAICANCDHSIVEVWENDEWIHYGTLSPLCQDGERATPDTEVTR